MSAKNLKGEITNLSIDGKLFPIGSDCEDEKKYEVEHSPPFSMTIDVECGDEEFDFLRELSSDFGSMAKMKLPIPDQHPIDVPITGAEPVDGEPEFYNIIFDVSGLTDDEVALLKKYYPCQMYFR